MAPVCQSPTQTKLLLPEVVGTDVVQIVIGEHNGLLAEHFIVQELELP